MPFVSLSRRYAGDTQAHALSPRRKAVQLLGRMSLTDAQQRPAYCDSVAQIAARSLAVAVKVRGAPRVVVARVPPPATREAVVVGVRTFSDAVRVSPSNAPGLGPLRWVHGGEARRPPDGWTVRGERALKSPGRVKG